MALFPDIGSPSGTPASDKSPVFAVIVFSALALGGLLMMVNTVPRTHRFAVDERGLWWRAGRKTDLIEWAELRAVRGQEWAPPAKDEPNAKAKLTAQVFTPADPASSRDTRHC